MTFIFNPFTGNFDADTSVSLAAVGSSPNANAATLTGQVLNLQPADGSNPGVVTTAAQTFAGAKTFSNTIVGSISGNAATVTTNANLTGDVTSTGNATSYNNTVPATKGGTAQSTYATGDTIYASAANTLSKRTIGSTGDVLTVAGGIPTWAPPAAGSAITSLTGDVTASGPGAAAATIANLAVTNAKIANTTIDLTAKVTGTLPAANGGTAQSTYATGDMIYASAANTLSKRTIGSTGNVLTVAGGIPTWAPAAAPAPNYQISSSSGSFSSSSASYVDVTNLTTTITTTGRPVVIQVIADGSSLAFLDYQNSSGVQSAGLQVAVLRDGSIISEQLIAYGSTGVTVLGLDFNEAVSGIRHFDVPSAASHTYKIQAKRVGASFQVNNAKLVTYEI